MLVIKPIEDKNEQRTLCDLCALEFREDMFAYKAYDGEALLGVAQFDIEGESSRMLPMKQSLGTKEDFEGMFILGRAVMNFLDLCGVKSVVYDCIDEADMRMAKLLGFKDDCGKMTISLAGLFTTPCSEKHK